LLIGMPLLVWGLYVSIPVFQKKVNETIFAGTIRPDIDTTAGIDNGGRPDQWLAGISQFHSPLFGTGFFHRGGASGIYPTGSHNFFLQLFLETGIPGGLMILYIFYLLWKQADSPSARAAGIALSAKASLIAAVICGMGGEYFYGGMGIFTLFLICA